VSIDRGSGDVICTNVQWSFTSFSILQLDVLAADLTKRHLMSIYMNAEQLPSDAVHGKDAQRTDH
jgi:hypothetical protein